MDDNIGARMLLSCSGPGISPRNKPAGDCAAPGIPSCARVLSGCPCPRLAGTLVGSRQVVPAARAHLVVESPLAAPRVPAEGPAFTTAVTPAPGGWYLGTCWAHGRAPSPVLAGSALSGLRLLLLWLQPRRGCSPRKCREAGRAAQPGGAAGPVAPSLLHLVLTGQEKAVSCASAAAAPGEVAERRWLETCPPGPCSPCWLPGGSGAAEACAFPTAPSCPGGRMHKAVSHLAGPQGMAAPRAVPRVREKVWGAWRSQAAQGVPCAWLSAAG